MTTLLIVDDTPEKLLALATFLSRHHHIKVATGGTEALEIAMRSPRPDLILLDSDMPPPDGFDVCARLAENPETQDIPVLLMLTDGIIGTPALAEKIGVAGLMEAGATNDEIAAEICHILDLSGQGAP